MRKNVSSWCFVRCICFVPIFQMKSNWDIGLLRSYVFARLQMTLNVALSLSDLALVYYRLESLDRDLFRFEDPTHSTAPSPRVTSSSQHCASKSWAPKRKRQLLRTRTLNPENTNNAREAVKTFKVAPRRSKRDEMIEDVEKKVNTERLGLTPDGRKYGYMIPMEEPTLAWSGSAPSPSQVRRRARSASFVGTNPFLVTMLQMTLNAVLFLSDTTGNYTSDNDKAELSVIWRWEV